MSLKNHLRFQFKGPPNELEAQAAPGGLQSRWPSPEVEMGKQRYGLECQTGEDGLITSLKLTLPAHTPPGKTEAVVHIGDKSYPATIEVGELTRIVAEPASVALTGKPGTSTAATVRVTNAGNVSRRIEGTQTISLRRADALSLGVRKAFKETGGDVVSRLIALGNHLSSETVESVRFDFKADFSALAAGDQRTVEVSAHIPDEIDRSIKWRGNLSLLGMAVTVTLDLQDKEGERR